MIHVIPPVVMSEDKYEAGCGVGDVGCMIEEQIVRWSIDLMNFVIDALDWALKIGSFNATDGDGNATNDWLNAIGMTEVWIGIAGVFGVLLVTMITVTVGIVKHERDTVMRALIGCALSVPATIASIWFVAQLLSVVELIPREILDNTLGEVDMKTAVREFLIPGMNHSTAENMQEVGEGMLAQTNRVFNPMIIWLVLGVFLTAVLLIIVINVIRNLMLQVAIGTAPIAFMMLPSGMGKNMIATWAKTVAAILLIKPIMVTWVCLMLTGMLESNGSIYGFEGFKYIFGMLLVVLVPFMVFGMFEFIGLDFDGGGREAHRTFQDVGRRFTGSRFGRGMGVGAETVGRGVTPPTSGGSKPMSSSQTSPPARQVGSTQAPPPPPESRRARRAQGPHSSEPPTNA